MRGSILRAYADGTSAVRYTINCGAEICDCILNDRIRAIQLNWAADVAPEHSAPTKADPGAPPTKKAKPASTQPTKPASTQPSRKQKRKASPACVQGSRSSKRTVKEVDYAVMNVFG